MSRKGETETETNGVGSGRLRRLGWSMEEEVVDEGKEETEERATKEGGSGRAGRSEKSGNGTEEAGAEESQ